jgi:hypothetical protein
MADNLTCEHLKPGVHQQDVEALIDPPLRKRLRGSFGRIAEKPDDLVEDFNLCEYSGFHVDANLLAIHCDVILRVDKPPNHIPSN